MNLTPRPLTQYPPEFQQIIREKSNNFVGREFVFTAITNFLHKFNSGYFTIVGVPGSGKSAILAKYVTENPDIFYYNAQVEGENQAAEFIATICTQLMERMGNRESEMGNGDNSDFEMGSWFLSWLLQKISPRLQPQEKLIVAIDALDAIDYHRQPPGSNLFYLPRYLPENVYFLLTRRPFLKEKSGLLIETPSQVLNLDDYPQQNQADVRFYIQQFYRNTPPFLRGAGGDLNSPITTNQLNKQNLLNQLTNQSENNFMYLTNILPEITNNLDPESLFNINEIELTARQNTPNSEQFIPPIIPPGLETYYQEHWQRIKGQELSAIEIAILKIIVKQNQPISGRVIAQMIDEDEYEVENAIANWIEFLQTPKLDGETHYRLYHSSFCHWLGQQL